MALDPSSPILPSDASSTEASIPTDVKDNGPGGASSARARLAALAFTDPATGKAKPVTAADRMPTSQPGVKEIVVPLTVQAAAYAAGNLLGAKIPLPSLVRGAGLTGLLQSVHLISKSGQKPLAQVAIFNADPSASTLTDKANPTVAPADLVKMIEIPQLSDWRTFGTPTKVSSGQMAEPFALPAGAVDGYAAVQTLAAVTFPTADDLILVVRVIQY